MDGFVWGNRNPQKGAVRIPWVFTEPVGLYGAETGTPSLTPSFMLLPSPLLSFTVDTTVHGTRKLNSSLRIPPPGTLGKVRASDLPLGCSSHVPGHRLWKPAHRPDQHHRHPPPHTRVLLPLQPVPGRRLLVFHHRPQDAGEPLDSARPSPLYALPRCMPSTCSGP